MFNGRQVWTAGRPVWYQNSVNTKPHWSDARLMKKTLLRWQQMLLQNLDVPFSINGAFTAVPLTHDAMGTNTPPYHHRCWLLNFVLIIIQIVLLLFGPSMISRNNLKCGHSTLFHFGSVHLR
ncbi:hypothetical protein ILYODFUR_029097 [Ilyodon furcidens]|uniref:Uncharacterized protein n=1 Tax=Ilyodon furcidens TaxID=33524 RepID=A0ABV0UJY8_9TELE